MERLQTTERRGKCASVVKVILTMSVFSRVLLYLPFPNGAKLPFGFIKMILLF